MNEPEERPAEGSESPVSPSQAQSPPAMGALSHTEAMSNPGAPDHADPEDDVIEEEPEAPFRPPLELIEEKEESIEKRWYILKVQVNREDTIREALGRRVKIAGLDRFFGEIVVPTEDVAEITKTGKRRVVKRKLYPGYIVIQMAINDESWFLVRETAGIGDFTGSAGKPSPMTEAEIEKILRLSRPPEEGGREPRTAIPFKQHDRVRIKEGHFVNFEGEVDAIDEANGRVKVLITIFGRPTPYDCHYWQLEAI